MNFLSYLMFSSALLISAHAHAEIYKCTDPAGKIAYSETPCADARTVQKKVEIKVRPSPTGTEKKNEPSLAQQNEDFRRRKADQDAYDACRANKFSVICVGPTEWAVRERKLR